MTFKFQKKMLPLFLLLIFIMISPALSKSRTFTAGHAKFKDSRMEKIIKQLDPAKRRKAESAALAFGRAFFASGKNRDHRTLAKGFIRNYFQTFNRKQKEALTAVMYYITLQYLDKDLKEIEKSMQKMARVRRGLRKQLKMIQNKYPKLRQNKNRITPPPLKIHPSRLIVQAQSINLKIEYSQPKPDTANNDLVNYLENEYETGSPLTIKGFKSLLYDMKGKLDAMNEMSEMTSLRLQMTMDRRSKFISTLSQIMKKTSTSLADTDTQNVK
ncbi:MAG: hypothetical protein ABFR36_09600 [Acidobacteriota bacterium]